MQIDPKTTIAGQASVRVRDFLRRHGSDFWGLEFAQKRLKIDSAATQALVDELLKLGYIEQASDFDDGPYFRTTGSGGTFSLASAAKPVRRSTVEKTLRAFLHRVVEVNNQSRFTHRIARVEVFGSYLTDADRLGDLDLAVTLESKESDFTRREAIHHAHIRAAVAAGRRFRNITEEVCWPQLEVLQYLKARSRVISLHSSDDPAALGAERRTIYP